ncbi:Carboxypeptidase [Penicillium macrosclerotiorum]|uniref:Carboxypeptidase n=1 Tax=Penicillium macrosclerotiorum TaxID=303699 RepID=UPI00254775A1|nr:Carboxypeptidase [Penicillium macrosclerotiorum]KAJ5673856.1 Carboxypeptidase [Penicillium macrosclerotiorum]
MDLTAFFFFFQHLWSISNMVLSRSASSSQTSRFEVHSLPNSPSLPTSWAGRLPVLGADPGNEIFFWLFQPEDPARDEDLIIWFNGGPGCSSLVGLTGGNGPFSFISNSTQLERNPYSWTQLGHVLYVDQPVGTGFSTASNPYPVRNNEQVTESFTKWLDGFWTYFPHLRSKKIHLMGESYAGIYIPYFAAGLLHNPSSPSLNIRSMSLGDGSWANAAALSSVAMGSYMHAHATMLKVPQDILSTFAEADRICSFDDVLEQAQIYPPKGKIHIPGDPQYFNYRRLQSRDMTNVLDAACDIQPTTPAQVRSSIFNSTCYGPCATYSTATDYMAAISAAGTGPPCWDVYDIHHDCSTVNAMALIAKYFSRSDVQEALHVRGRGNYTACNSTILETLLAAPSVVPPAYTLLPSLVTDYNISLHIYNGEWDMLLNHIGTELSIQNMTWRGVQGFSQKPQRLFYADDPAPVSDSQRSTSARANVADHVAGYWASERGVSYHLFRGAGHSVFGNKPREMFAYVRDIVVGAKAD